MGILIRIAILTAGIFLAAYLLPGIRVEGYGAAIKAAILLGIMNAVIKPILIILTLPITILTLGLFALAINGFILWFVGRMLSGFEVTGAMTAILGAIVISIFSIVLNRFF